MIIVIHPGSSNLRIGRASDPNPITITHAVAIKRSNGGKVHKDSFLPEVGPREKWPPQLLKELEDGRLRMSHVLQSSAQSNGNRRYATPPQQISAFNRRSTPENTGLPCDFDWLAENQETVVGDDIFRVDPKANYNIHYPIRRGILNLHSGIRGSLYNVLDLLQTIWEYAITEKLGIPLK